MSQILDRGRLLYAMTAMRSATSSLAAKDSFNHGEIRTPQRYNPSIQMTLASGSRLGPLQILAPLGAGGMGEVYRARDTRIDRDVAVKVLPEGLATDATRLARFTPVWSKTGEIFYVDGSAILAASIATSGGSPTVSRPVVLFQTRGDTNLAPVFEVTPDGKTFYMLRTRGRDQVSVILNWPRDLAQIEAAATSAAR